MQKIVMDKKQRVIAIVLGLVVIVLIWQVVGIFSSSTTPAPPTTPVNKAVPSATTNAAAPTNSPVVISAPVAQTVVTADTSFNISAYQKKYLALLEEYKMVELQKQIAADKQAIALSQAATVEALNKINQLGGVADLQEANTSSIAGTSDTSASTGKTTPQKADTSGSYSLVYTGLQDNDWTATIKQGNSTYDVMLGTVLNGTAKVIDINNDGVVLQDKTSTIHLTFDGSTVTPNAPQNPAPDTKPNETKVETKPLAQGIVQTPVLPHPNVSAPSAPAATPVAVIPSSTLNQTSLPKATTPPTIKTPTTDSTQTTAETSWLQKELKKVETYIQNEQAAHAPTATAPKADSSSAHTLPPMPPMQPKTHAVSPTSTPIVAANPNVTTHTQPTSAKATSVMDLNPNEFTIQLGVLSSSEDLQKFIASLNLTENFYTYMEKNNLNRYGVIYGHFSTREEANKALKDFPAAWKKSGPYIQKISSVQQQAST